MTTSIGTSTPQAGWRSVHRPEKIHALTALRFFAALWVVIYHSHWSEFPAMKHENLAGHILSLGYISVTFFFMLSGYILAMVYLSRDLPVQRKSFFTARLARIYPLYLLTLVADFPHLLFVRVARQGVAAASSQVAGIFLGSVFMLQAWTPHLRGINFPSWSLSVEAVFYLIFPFLGVWLWKLDGARVWVVAAALWIGSQCLVYWITPHIKDYTASYNPLLHIPTFALGILMARWQTQQRARRGASPANASTIAISLVLAALGFIAVLYWKPFFPHENLNHGLMAPVFFLLIWALSASRSLPARILSVRWLVVLGEASFGLYLVHIPILNLYIYLHWAEVPILYPTYLAVCIALSLFSFYWIEAPARKWILRVRHTRPKETMEVASDAQ